MSPSTIWTEPPPLNVGDSQVTKLLSPKEKVAENGFGVEVGGRYLAIIGMFRLKLQLRSIQYRNKKQSVRSKGEREKRVWPGMETIKFTLFKMNCNLYLVPHIKPECGGEVPWQSPLLRKFKLCNTSSQTSGAQTRAGIITITPFVFIHSPVSLLLHFLLTLLPSPLPPAASSRGGDEDEEERDEGKTQADSRKEEKRKKKGETKVRKKK